MPRFHCITFGCQMNVNDASWLERALGAQGWERAPEAEADMVFIFTCSVREKPEQKVHSAIGRVRRANPGACVAVAGCVAQQLGAAFLEKYPQVRLVLGSDGIIHAPEAALKLMADPALRLSFLDFTADYPDRAHFLPGGPSASAFVNIMQGCDNFCAYCIVPYTRGPAKSRPADAVLDECRAWLEGGACDITLLGQNVNAYESLPGGFAELLHKVAALPGLRRLHFVSAHPRDMSAGVISAFAELPVLSPRLHLPLQSGSDTVLERMGRGYTRETFLNICTALRKARPGMALSTDLIVGFPGESEAEFQDTLRIMEEADFMSSFSFCYSDRPGTRASAMPFKVPQEQQLERLNRLQTLQDELSARWLQSRTGKECELLMEGRGREAGQWQGRSPWGDTVNILLPGEPRPGEIVRARITECRKHSLIAEPC